MAGELLKGTFKILGNPGQLISGSIPADIPLATNDHIFVWVVVDTRGSTFPYENSVSGSYTIPPWRTLGDTSSLSNPYKQGRLYWKFANSPTDRELPTVGEASKDAGKIYEYWGAIYANPRNDSSVLSSPVAAVKEPTKADDTLNEEFITAARNKITSSNTDPRLAVIFGGNTTWSDPWELNGSFTSVFKHDVKSFRISETDFKVFPDTPPLTIDHCPEFRYTMVGAIFIPLNPLKPVSTSVQAQWDIRSWMTTGVAASWDITTQQPTTPVITGVEASWDVSPRVVTITDASWDINASRDDQRPNPLTPVDPRPKPLAGWQMEPLLIGTGSGYVAAQDQLVACTTVHNSSYRGTLEFEFVDNGYLPYLDTEQEVRFKGNIYTVRSITLTKRDGKKTKKVYCERLYYQLSYFPSYPAQAWPAPADALSKILEGTGWTGVCELTSTSSWSSEEPWSTPLALLVQLADTFDACLFFDDQAKTVTLRKTGYTTLANLTYGKDIAGVAKAVDSTNQLTRIYPVSSVQPTNPFIEENQGIPYVEVDNPPDYVKSRTYDFGMVDGRTMKSQALALLATRSRPVHSYSYQVSSLMNRPDPIDRFDLFDIVVISDFESKDQIASSVQELTINWLDHSKSTVTLSSRIPSLASGVASSRVDTPDGGFFTGSYAVLTGDRLMNLVESRPTPVVWLTKDGDIGRHTNGAFYLNEPGLYLVSFYAYCKAGSSTTWNCAVTLGTTAKGLPNNITINNRDIVHEFSTLLKVSSSDLGVDRALALGFHFTATQPGNMVIEQIRLSVNRINK